MQLLGAPLDYAYSKVPPRIKESISQSVYAVLAAVRESSGGTVNQQSLLDRISAEVGLDVSRLEQVFDHDIRHIDFVAQERLTANRRAAALEGGATGAAGLPGLVVDIPALYWLVFRTVQEISLCYGFPVDTAVEQAHVLKVVDVGHYLEKESKRRGMLELESVQSMIRDGVPVKDLERAVVAKGVQTLARHLSTGITRRKLAQTMALVGGVVGASVNHALVGDVGLTAYHAYRRRFLKEVALRRSSAVS